MMSAVLLQVVPNIVWAREDYLMISINVKSTICTQLWVISDQPNLALVREYTAHKSFCSLEDQGDKLKELHPHNVLAGHKNQRPHRRKHAKMAFEQHKTSAHTGVFSICGTPSGPS